MDKSIVVKATFLQFGKSAPSNSGYKGKLNCDSIFGGYTTYLSRDDATKDSMGESETTFIDEEVVDKNTISSSFNLKNSLDGSLMDYTSRASATHDSSEKEYFTMTNEGKLYTDEDRNKWIENSKSAFSKDGDIVWNLVVSLDSFDSLKEYEIKDQEDFAKITKTVLYKSFKKLKLDPQNMIWWEDYHTNTKHPHIHVNFLEKEHSRDRGKLTKKEIDYVKGMFVNEIAARKLYKEKYMDNAEDALKKITPLKQKMINEINNLPYEILNAIANLYSQLPRTGRLQYNAASMIPYREQLDNIVNQVLQCDSCKEDYSIFTQELDKLDNIRNDLTNDNISHLKETHDQKLRVQIANSILKSFKDLKETDKRNMTSLNEWKIANAIQIVSKIYEGIDTKDFTPQQVEVVNLIKDNNLKEAGMLAERLGDSSNDKFLKGATSLLNAKSEAQKADAIAQIYDAENSGNKEAQRVMNFYRKGQSLNKTDYHGFKGLLGRRLPRGVKHAIKQHGQEIENEIEAYLRNDERIAVSVK